MDIEGLNEYIYKTQKFTLSNNIGGLISYIKEQKEKYPPKSANKKFFEAEEAFYNKRYDFAIKDYLEVKEIPNFQFFCYRATSYLLLHSLHQEEKALSFAKKALKFYPLDCTTLQVLSDIYSALSENDKADVINKKIANLKKATTSSISQSDEESLHFLPIGTEELAELTQLFSKN